MFLVPLWQHWVHVSRTENYPYAELLWSITREIRTVQCPDCHIHKIKLFLWKKTNCQLFLCNACIWKMLNYYFIIQAILFQITNMPHKLTLLVQDYFDDCKQLRLWFEHYLAHFNICYKRNVKLICRQIPYRYKCFLWE